VRNKFPKTGCPRHASASLVLVILLSFAATNSRSRQTAKPAQPAKPAYAIEALTPDGQARLRTILDEAKLGGLRRPDFSPYKTPLVEFYCSTGYSLAWTFHSKPTPQALAMIRVLENADAEGLVPADYDGRRWANRIAALDRAGQPAQADMVQFDVALTVSSMRYISDLHSGRVDPRLFHPGFGGEHPPYDLAQFLRERIIHGPDIEAALEEAEPPLPAYRRSVQALDRYQKLAREYHGPPLPVPRKTVDPGDSYWAMPQLAYRLRLLGDLAPDAKIAPSRTVYQGSLVDAIKHFQRRHGLDSDGRIGPRTFRELNTPLAHRIRQLRLSLERLRWLPDASGRARIIVNIPEFRLHVVGKDRRQILAMSVVVGKARKYQTPVFASAMRTVIFRPYWDVPISIQENELVPDIQKDRGYLEKHGYEVVDRRRRVVSEGKVNAALLEDLASGTIFARQKPGPGNSLGLIKFDLPNPFTVFLHGTPATALFSRPRRDFSHGCIRVEDPVALAAWVLRDNPGWTPDRIRQAMNGDRTLAVNLAKPIPILIVYRTAVVAENGEVRFFRDIYGLDAKLERAIASGRPYSQAAGSGTRY